MVDLNCILIFPILYGVQQEIETQKSELGIPWLVKLWWATVGAAGPFYHQKLSKHTSHFSPSHSHKGIPARGCFWKTHHLKCPGTIQFLLPLQDSVNYYLLDEAFLITSFTSFPMPSSAHILIVCITRLELTISCWMWLVIFQMWLFPSQLPYKILNGKKQLFSLSASPLGPSSVPGACGWAPCWYRRG